MSFPQGGLIMFQRMTFCLLVSVGLTINAQTINVRGTVSNQGGNPIGNAVVALSIQQLADTTESDGRYAITRGEASVRRTSMPQKNVITMDGGVVTFRPRTASPLRVEVFDAKGTLIKRERHPDVPAAIYRCNVATGVQANRLLFIKAAVGRKEITFRYFSLHNGRHAATTSVESGTRNENRQMNITVVNDTLTAAAANYTTKTIMITSYDQELNITLDTAGGVDDSLSAGCGKSGAPKGARHLTINVDGTPRTYWLWVPDGYDSNTPIPLIFAWHGSGGDGDEVRRKYFHLEPAVGDGAIIVYPDGLPVDGGSTGWDLDGEGIDMHFFDTLLVLVAEEYCIDRNRVFSTGYSFGGMFTYALACNRGNKLRGIAPTAGAFFGGDTCPTPVPAWIAHATNDDLVQYSWAEDARDTWLRTNGCSTTTTPTSPGPCVAYECPEDAPVHWCVHEEGHEWPSFAADGIWAFFSRL